MNVLIQIEKPEKNIWVHTTAYHRYATYQKFAHQAEDLCRYFSDHKSAPVLNILMDNFKKLGTLDIASACPLSRFSLRSEKLNASHFVAPLLPAGRYRFDLNLTFGKNGISYFDVKIYFRISDFRLWH